MSKNTNATLITAAVRPNDSLDLIASAFQNEIKWWHHSYSTLVEMYSIIIERRDWWMLCTVYGDIAENNKTYQLTKWQVDSNIMNNNNRIEFWLGISNPAHTLVFPFVNRDSPITILHNMNKKVSVFCITDTGEYIYGGITYVDDNSIILNFLIPFTGNIVILLL